MLWKNGLLAILMFVAVFYQSESKRCYKEPLCYCEYKNKSSLQITCSYVNQFAPLRNFLKQFVRIYRLRLTNCNNLTDLPSKALDGVTLQVLVMYCPIKTVADDALYGIKNLSIVNMAQTKFSTVPKGLSIPSIKTLQINNGSLDILDDSLMNLVSATSLIFDNNYIRDIKPSTFFHSKNLQYLNLSYNEITQVDPSTFDYTMLIKDLDMSNNQLVYINNSFRNLNPERLNLYSNNLTTLEDVLHPGMWSLKNLNIGKNQINYITAPEFMLNSLSYLTLSENQMTELDERLLTKMPLIYYIRLDQNQLINIPKYFFQPTPFINEIYLNQNKLTSLEGIFDKSQGLRILHLNDNQLISLKGVFSYYTQNLIKVNLSSNNLTSIALKDVDHLFLVTKLNLSYNAISKLETGCFKNSQKLGELDLSYNAIKTLNKSIQYLHSLHHLYLTNAQLEKVEDEELIGIPYLNEINFQNNKLISLNGAFRNQQFLKVLNIAQNNLSVLTIDSFHESKIPSKLFYLWMADNPWSCDCRLLWLLELMKRKDGKGLIDDPKCQSPDYLEHKSLRNLTYNDLYLWHNDCPNPCECTCHSNGIFINTTVDCAKRNLKTVPYLYPTNVHSIFLNNNEIEVFNGFNDLNSTLIHPEILNLENNRLKEVRLFLPSSLKELYLAGNKMQHFPYKDIHNLNLISISLSRNPWICNCDTWAFHNWLVTNRDNITDVDEIRCTSHYFWDDFLIRNRVIIDLNHGDFCDNYFRKLVFAGTALIITIILICVGCFYCRKLLLAFLYSCGCLWVHSENQREDIFDAFLCFAQQDQEFAFINIAKILELKDPKYRLCIWGRDIVPPFSSNEVENALAQSSKIIIILTNHFLQDPTCMQLYSSSLACSLEQNANRIIIITKGNLPPSSEIDASLNYLMGICACLRFGEIFFWKKLRYYLPKKKMYDFSSMEDATEEYEPLNAPS